MKKGLACVFLSLMFFLFHAAGVASDRPEYIAVKKIELGSALGTTNAWLATAYQVKETDEVPLWLTDMPARLCFHQSRDTDVGKCFDAKDRYEAFPILVELKQITIRESRSPNSGILFIAEVGGKAEPTHLIMLWTYHPSSGTFQNVLPAIRINLQGEYLVIPKLKEGIEGIFITANRIWNGEREYLFGHHQYAINIYVQDNKGKYVLKSQYVTRKRYPGLDDVDKVDVISKEMKTIKKLLMTKQ